MYVYSWTSMASRGLRVPPDRRQQPRAGAGAGAKKRRAILFWAPCASSFDGFSGPGGQDEQGRAAGRAGNLASPQTAKTRRSERFERSGDKGGRPTAVTGAGAESTAHGARPSAKKLGRCREARPAPRRAPPLRGSQLQCQEQQSYQFEHTDVSWQCGGGCAGEWQCSKPRSGTWYGFSSL